MTIRVPEREPLFIDLSTQLETMHKSMEKAQKYIAAKKAGDVYAAFPELYKGINEKAKKAVLRNELSQLISSLNAVINDQLSKGRMHQLDMEDGSYDNAHLDMTLREYYSKIRNMRISLDNMFMFKNTRKFTAWLREDIPAWCTIRYRQTKNLLKQAGKVALVGGTAAAVAAGGYYIYNGGWGALGNSKFVTNATEFIGNQWTKLADSSIGQSVGSAVARGAAAIGFGEAPAPSDG